MPEFCKSLTRFSRRRSNVVNVGGVAMGGDNPVRIQSMTNTDTLDTEASAAQIMRIADAGGEIVRLTAQGKRQAANLSDIRKAIRAQGYDTPLVADIHFTPDAAFVAAENVEKVRINPGNFGDDQSFSRFRQLIAICRKHDTALRIGVNHGSLSPAIMDRYGDTTEGMVASAMEYLEVCREEGFDQVVLSMKSSNVRVMVQAYRMLCREMEARGMHYPLHLGVTEAGNGEEARVKSAVGIGALMADGIGDTIRVSLTEAPEAEIPVAEMIVAHFAGRHAHTPIPDAAAKYYSPYEYRRRPSDCIEGIGGGKAPVLWSEMTPRQKAACTEVTIEDIDDIPAGRILVLNTSNINGTAEQRAFFTLLDSRGLRNPVIIKRSYRETDPEKFRIMAAADMGMLFLDGYGDGIWIENDPAAKADSDGKYTQSRTPYDHTAHSGDPDARHASQQADIVRNGQTVPGHRANHDIGQQAAQTDTDSPGYFNGHDRRQPITSETIDSLSLAILQAARVRMSKPEYIACPSCGRTLYDIQSSLNEIKRRTAHLTGVKIGVMGCIVNGPGEMADADYGYVGSGRGHITLYRGKDVVKRNIPEERAIDELLALIESDAKVR